MYESNEFTERLVISQGKLNQTHKEEKRNIFYQGSLNWPARSDPYEDELRKRYRVTNEGIILIDVNSSNGIEESSNQYIREICLICQKTLNSKYIVHLECCHQYCYKCIGEYLKTEFSATCPHHVCKSEISEVFLSSLLSIQDYQKFLRYRNFCELVENESLMWCPVPDCEGYDIKRQINKLKCNKCSFVYCSKCSHAWHENSYCNFEEAHTVQFYMEAYNLNLCPRCKIIIDARSTYCSLIMCTKCKYKFCKCCGGNNNCIRKKIDYNMRLFDILYLSLLIFFIPFHTFIFVFLNLKYIKAGINGSKALKDFTTRHIIMSYFFAFLIAILFIPIYFFILPSAFIKRYPFPFIIIRRRPKFNLFYTLFMICWPYFFLRFIVSFIFLNIFGLVLLPYRICRLLGDYLLNQKPEYGRYGLKSRFSLTACFWTKITFI